MRTLRRHINACAAAGMLLAVSTVLTGCGEKQQAAYEPEVTALEVQQDGKLTETIIDVLDQSWYSSAELSDMITQSVAEYNAQAGDEAVTAENVVIENGQVLVSLLYDNASDYAAYNHITFYNGSMLSAEMAGFLFDTEFFKVEKNTEVSGLIDREEPLSHKEYQVLIGDTEHEYHVTGKVRYISSNARMVDPLTVRYSGTDAEAAQETGNAGSEMGAGEDGLIYILYEF